MNDIVFKVAPTGEGKTKWLLHVAQKYASAHKVYLYTDSPEEFSKFCEKYFNLFNVVCPVLKYEEEELHDSDIVLVDDLFTHSFSTMRIEFMKQSCYKMFITVNGVAQDTENVDPKQVSIFDLLEEH